MKKIVTTGLVCMSAIMFLAACDKEHAQTVDSGNTVSVATTVSSSSESSSSQESTASQTTGDTLIKQAIAKIETTKNMMLEGYDIIIDNQTNDVIELNIRKTTGDRSENVGLFRFTKSTQTLEEQDYATGEYKELK